MSSTDVALVHFMHEIALEIYRSTWRTAFDVNLSRIHNVTTPQIPVMVKFSIHHLLFVLRDNVLTSSELCHSTVKTRQQLLRLKNWDVQEKDVSSRSLFFLLPFLSFYHSFSIYSSFLFPSPILLQLTSESMLRFRTADWFDIFWICQPETVKLP
jgi:hypothetical protein